VRTVEDDAARPLSPVPFVAALVGFVVIAGLAFAFLRSDDEGRLVRPDRLTETGPDAIRATVLDQPGCGRVERAQVDLGETEVRVELVAVDAEGPCSDVAVELVADITLPEPIDGRRLLPGVGRLQLPCTCDRTSVTCGERVLSRPG
jgi:hypothetical protein